MEETRVPDTAEQHFEVEGLAAEVEILVDRWGVPHIYAASQPRRLPPAGLQRRPRPPAADRPVAPARHRLPSRQSWPGVYATQDRAARLLLYRGDMAAEWAAYGPEAKRRADAFTAASTPTSA